VTIDVFLAGDMPAGFRKLANTTKELLENLKKPERQHTVYIQKALSKI
jgi:hypothetical protein